jgi:hypothetical protein
MRCAQGEVVVVFLDGDCLLWPFFLRDHWDAHRECGRLVCGAEQKIRVVSGELPLDSQSYLASLPDLDVGSDHHDRLTVPREQTCQIMDDM